MILVANRVVVPSRVTSLLAMALVVSCSGEEGGRETTDEGLSQGAPKETHTYKVVGDLEILADVYRPSTSEGLNPVTVWIHGGALIVGHREWIDQNLFSQLLEAGHVIVSIDYRLAPETLLPEIIEDIEDAFSWVREQGPSLFAADPDRIAVMGMSAGGYLTLASGHRVQPSPKALVSYCGYGDLVGDWYSEPSTHARHNPRPISREEAYAQVGSEPISDSRERQGDGFVLYNHLRQRGEWPEAVSGWSPDSQGERFDPYMPLVAVTGDYPPTLLIHGTADTDVPYELSVMMAEEFAEHGVEHRLITLPDVEHCVDGVTDEGLTELHRQAVGFVSARLNP